MVTALTWQQRPPEIAYLLNPAFCGLIIQYCIQRYRKERSTGDAFPYPLAFLILPIVLHQRTRASIPKKTKEQFHVWLQSNSYVRIGLAERARQLVPVTRESLSFLMQSQALTIDETSGGIIVPRNFRRQAKDTSIEDEEIADCYKKAETLGRWFARAGSQATIFTVLGVAP